jgi:ketosteroid isomerase-like protein
VEGWAIEVVIAEVTYKMSAKNNPVSMQTKILRVLKRQSDGSWRFARVASNN